VHLDCFAAGDVDELVAGGQISVDDTSAAETFAGQILRNTALEAFVGALDHRVALLTLIAALDAFPQDLVERLGPHFVVDDDLHGFRGSPCRAS
jgi:hypothetical protein